MSQTVILGMKTELFLTEVFAVKFQSIQQRKCVAILGTCTLNWERKQMFLLQALQLGTVQWQTEIFYQICAFSKGKKKQSLVRSKVLTAVLKLWFSRL